MAVDPEIQEGKKHRNFIQGICQGINEIKITSE